MTDTLTQVEAFRIVREAVKDKSYALTPLGAEIAGYLHAEHMSLRDSSYRDRESGLDKLARYFADLELADFEPPVGRERLLEFLDSQWGTSAPGTYNKNLVHLRAFFKYCCLEEKLRGDPTLRIKPAKSRGVYRTTFSADQTRAIIAQQESLRDRIALRLVLNYGLRSGELLSVQFKHFDHERKRLTIFGKGRKVRELPLPDPHLWKDLERHILMSSQEPQNYLLTARRRLPKGRPGAEIPDRQMSRHGRAKWWYGCLENAGIVAQGTTSGERMHKARHTAGQRVLDATGNLKAVQKLLGHASIRTTGDVYADWDVEQLATTMAKVLADE